jgi:hypothetical protein
MEKVSIYYLYTTENFPSILIFNLLAWKKIIGFSMFSMLVNYIMENNKKFRPAHDLKLMDQIRQMLQYHSI